MEVHHVQELFDAGYNVDRYTGIYPMKVHSMEDKHKLPYYNNATLRIL